MTSAERDYLILSSSNVVCHGKGTLSVRNNAIMQLKKLLPFYGGFMSILQISPNVISPCCRSCTQNLVKILVKISPSWKRSIEFYQNHSVFQWIFLLYKFSKRASCWHGVIAFFQSHLGQSIQEGIK